MKKGKRGPYKEIDLAQVEAHAARGMTQEQIADALGIGTFTLYARKREIAEFAEAIKRGRAKGIGIIANKFFESAQAGNTSAQIFFEMPGRMGRAQRQACRPDGLHRHPAEQGRAILAAMAEGKLTPSEASSLLSAIANQAKIAEADELTRRVAALEAKGGKP